MLCFHSRLKTRLVTTVRQQFPASASIYGGFIPVKCISKIRSHVIDHADLSLSRVSIPVHAQRDIVLQFCLCLSVCLSNAGRPTVSKRMDISSHVLPFW